MFEYMDFEEPKKDGDVDVEASSSRTENETPNLQPYTWKGKLRSVLHSKPCHIAVIVLVLVDSLLVITEILLDLHIVEVAEESPAPEIVHYCSITILSVFMVEIALKLLVDWHHFWSHKMEIFDAIVVVIAFGFDVGILFLEDGSNDALIAVELLILLRLWRVVRVVNGIILTVKNEGDARVHALKAKLKEKEEELEKSEEKNGKQEKEIERLRKILEENGIHVEQLCEEPLEGDTEHENGAVINLEESHNVISIDA